jgi:hypothetical protein
VFWCSLGASSLPTKKSETTCRLPWNYSFLVRTLKWACCCDCPQQSIGVYSLEPTNYSCTCLRAAVLCSCGRNILPHRNILSCNAYIKHVRDFWGQCPSWLPSFHQRYVLRVCVAERYWVSAVYQTFYWLSSLLFRSPRQLIHREYNNRWAKVNQRRPAHHPLDAHYDSAVDEPNLH